MKNSRSKNSPLITEGDYSQELHDKLVAWTLKNVDDDKKLLSREQFIDYMNTLHDRRIVLWDCIECKKPIRTTAYILYFSDYKVNETN